MQQADHEVGRLIASLKDLGILEDTLIYLIIGDNGASAEGTINGCFNEMCTLNGMPGIETVEFLKGKINDFGTQGVQPLCGRLGARDVHALSVDQADRFAFRRHAQRNDHSLARRHQG
jgi:arylsulfatase A-like enzyme